MTRLIGNNNNKILNHMNRVCNSETRVNGKIKITFIPDGRSIQVIPGDISMEYTKPKVCAAWKPPNARRIMFKSLKIRRIWSVEDRDNKLTITNDVSQPQPSQNERSLKHFYIIGIQSDANPWIEDTAGHSAATFTTELDNLHSALPRIPVELKIKIQRESKWINSMVGLFDADRTNIGATNYTHYDCTDGSHLNTFDYIFVGNGLAAHFTPNLFIYNTHFVHKANRHCYDRAVTPPTWIYSDHGPLFVTLKQPIALPAPPAHVEYDDMLLLPEEYTHHMIDRFSTFTLK
eukprot:555511_1